MFSVYMITPAAGGWPLYIGQTQDLQKRMAVHRCRSKWLPKAHTVEVICRCDNRMRARTIEEYLIFHWQPTYNKAGKERAA